MGAARAEGRGAVALDGRMIDIPVVRRAERLLARAAAIAAFSREGRNVQWFTVRPNMVAAPTAPAAPSSWAAN